jgi:hypothetical protein
VPVPVCPRPPCARTRLMPGTPHPREISSVATLRPSPAARNCPAPAPKRPNDLIFLRADEVVWSDEERPRGCGIQVLCLKGFRSSYNEAMEVPLLSWICCIGAVEVSRCLDEDPSRRAEPSSAKPRHFLTVEPRGGTIRLRLQFACYKCGSSMMLYRPVSYLRRKGNLKEQVSLFKQNL